MVTIGTLNGGNITITTGGSAPASHPETRLFFRTDNEGEEKQVNLNIVGQLSSDIWESDEELEDDVIMVDGQKLAGSDLVCIDIGNTVTSITTGFDGKMSLSRIIIQNTVTSIDYLGAISENTPLNITFMGRTLVQVQEMEGYPWGIEDTSIFRVA